MAKAKISKKVCMLGTFGVGKTSLVQRYVNNLFNDQYKSTVGVQVLQKTVSLKNDEQLNLILWDLANIEKMSPVFENYFRGSSAAVVVFDATRPASFDLDDIHIEDFLNTNPDAALFFAANKIDLLENPQNIPTELNAIAEKFDGPLVATSASFKINSIAGERPSNLKNL